MSIKEKVKYKINQKTKKVALKIIKPFLPFIIIIIGLFFTICFIIDAIFIQEVQSDNTSMPEAQIELKNKCISKAEYLNTCNNYIVTEKTNYLLDVDDREIDKCVEWSHLYSIMAFYNMTYGTTIDEELLEKVSNEFISTFKYESNTIKIEKMTIDESGKEIIVTEEHTQYLLIESDTIIGHFKYNYDETTIELNGTKTTKKVFANEELIGEQYDRLKSYLKNQLHIRDTDLETDVQVVIQAANRIL